MIVSYKVLIRPTPLALEQEVQGMLRDGYRLHGYPFARGNDICQGMVKEGWVDKPDPPGVDFPPFQTC